MTKANGFLAAAGALALALSTGTLHATDVTAWRLFVSDHGDGRVTVLDALDGRIIDTFQLFPAQESGRALS